MSNAKAYRRWLQEQAKRRHRAAKLRAKGLTLQEIGDALGITRQRVGQILGGAKRENEAA